MSVKNKGLEKLGESFMTLANLILVLFLFNTYMQKEDFSLSMVFIYLYGIVSLYYYGYKMINRSQEV
jgi:ABC-type transport system involved in cytochrome c biogenesis permease subunit